MDNLHWELSVLSKSIHYKNLSAAADHVGLSQPQLSRIVSKLESSLNVVLLDRSAPRKSGWTPVAFKIADVYFRNSRKLTADLQELQSDTQITQLTVGTLEGLSYLAMKLCNSLFSLTKVNLLEVNVLDLNELEGHFEKDEFDLVFTSREPGRHKYKYVRTMGYQTFEKIESKSDLKVMSPFEFSRQAMRRNQKTVGRILLSNSLAVRKSYVEEFGGVSEFPSEVKQKKTGSQTEHPVYLIGSDLLNPLVWDKIQSLKL
jgi:LysR family transcriptional regulator, transcriptional activator for aaeXAB operon